MHTFHGEKIEMVKAKPLKYFYLEALKLDLKKSISEYLLWKVKDLKLLSW